MIPKNNRKASLLVTALMFAGMLTGAVTLVLNHDKKETPMNKTIIPSKLHTVWESKGKSFWSGFQFYFHTKQQLDALQQKETLTSEDSITIKNIDHQLNQIIHD